jgi:hypothetical protein
MSIRIKHEITLIACNLLLFLLLCLIGMFLCEFLFSQLIDLFLVGSNYKFPSVNKLYKWGGGFFNCWTILFNSSVALPESCIESLNSF